jgi:hypothetical protein
MATANATAAAAAASVTPSMKVGGSAAITRE